ncbi:glycoside hydrolase family 43 protein [Myxococcota bacterium]
MQEDPRAVRNACLAAAICRPTGCHETKTAARRQPSSAHSPLITHLYTADPSAHVFDDKLYLYPSHDLGHDLRPSADGDHYDMKDYHVFSMADVPGPVTDHGQVLHIDDVPWASRQLWAPDAARQGDTYYLFFPARDQAGVFRIGVATSQSPSGPFEPRPEPIAGSFSIDPAVFVDSSGAVYMYFGGLRGGQLQKWQKGTFEPEATEPSPSEPALGPRVAELTDDMTALAEPAREVVILDETERPLLAGDRERRFFEGAWVHEYDGCYYLSYSTGDTHYVAYAISSSPTGPFVYRGRVLNPVIGWSTHHSIVEFHGQWYLFYHDSSLSGGVDHRRCVKCTELVHGAYGRIQTVDP